MGRSTLSIKLAFAFGVCIAVLAGAAGQVRTAASTQPVLEQPSIQPSLSEATALDAVIVQPAAEVICLWRACPALMSHPLPTTRTSSERRATPRWVASTI